MQAYYLKNKEAWKNYRFENLERIKRRRKEIRVRDKAKIAAQKHASYLRNRSKENLRSRSWYLHNKERHLKTSQEWLQRNKERVREYKTFYDKAQAAANIDYKLKRTLRARLRAALKRNPKRGSAVRDLGCTLPELKLHLEALFYPCPRTQQEMTWTNYGLGKNHWQIDHKKALYRFELTDPLQWKIAAHYSNLQPLWFEDHVVKTRKDVSL
jgi:hypothetical protein